MYIISVDVGTTKLKACLFEIKHTCNMIAEAEAEYALYSTPEGGMEQDHEQWWQALCHTTKTIINTSGIKPEEVKGFSICGQMLGLVLVDHNGEPVRRPMNYLDRRAEKQWKEGICSGFRIGGYNVRKLLTSLAITKTAPLDVGDPLWRYKWVEENEPENFGRVYKWLDVKDYINSRCTGNFAATEDAAFVTMLYERANGKNRFNPKILKMYGIKETHMPKVIKSTDVVGYLTPEAAKEMGLAAGIPVFGGGGDASCIPLGSGYTQEGMTHVYIGTSGWVSTVCKKQLLDPINMIVAICGSDSGKFNYHAEMNAAGKCYEWVRDHIVLDKAKVYSDNLSEYTSQRDTNIYEHLIECAMEEAAGADGLIFTPWLAGERCPISASNPCGMFFNLSLKTSKASIIRSVLEGICYHIRWMIEKHEKTLQVSSVLRFVGGGALSPAVCQMLADITGRQVETIPWPQSAGAAGAAVIAAVGLGLIPDFDSVEDYIPVEHVYKPDLQKNELYSRYYQVYKKLYPSNKKLFNKLHEIRGNTNECL